MGYYTRYFLEWKIPEEFEGQSQCSHDKPDESNFCPECGLPTALIPPDEMIGDYIVNHEDMSWSFNRIGESQERARWYEHETDMKAMSSEFKKVLFTLRGEGEQAGDLWIKYFLDGAMQTAIAQITFDEFDPSKLE